MRRDERQRGLLPVRLMGVSLGRRLAAEGVGTAFLLAAVVGSGIMGERLAAGNVAVALLANAVATGAALVALILTFGPISGAHFNPLVTGAELLDGRLSRSAGLAYVVVQILGAFAGVAIAHLMFGEPPFSLSTKARQGLPQLFSEAVASFGLLGVVLGCGRRNPQATPFAVGAYITAAYWFTASTSFANPAVTLARSVSDTFAGIRFADVPGFLVAQTIGAATSMLFFRWLLAEVKHGHPNVQRPLSLHGELRTKHHGGGVAEPDRGREVPRL